MSKKTVCVIGAGACGILIANRLSRKFRVTVFEREPVTGGLCAEVDRTGPNRFNHFFSQNDKNLLAEIRSVGLGDRLFWKKAGQIVYPEDQLALDLNGPLDILRLSGSSFWQTFTALAALFLLPRQKLGKMSLEQFFRYFGTVPLMPQALSYKFGASAASVSAAYLLARCKEGKNNRIGCLAGGTRELFNAWENSLKLRGSIRTNTLVTRIMRETAGWLVQTAHGNEERYDILVSTIPLMETAGIFPGLMDSLGPDFSLNYLSIVCPIFRLKKPLSSGRWLFISSVSNEEAVCVDTASLTGENLVYFPIYYPAGTLPPADPVAKFKRFLIRINPAFSPDWIQEEWISAAERVEPVLSPRLLTLRQSCRGRLNSLYLTELADTGNMLKSLDGCVEKSTLLSKRIMEKC